MRAAILWVLLAVLGAVPAFAWRSRAKGVIDGDSLSVVNGERVAVNIRLYGLDAPERKQAFGYQARKGLLKLVSRRRLSIESVDTDHYGRNVALVRLDDGTLVNEVLVREGLAWVYEQYCLRPEVCSALRQAQAEAKTAGRGLWAEHNPMPPWDWRRQNKVEEWYAAPVCVLRTIARKIKVVIR